MTTYSPTWAPLEATVPDCSAWMYMSSRELNSTTIHSYKHSVTRCNIHISDDLRQWTYRNGSYDEKTLTLLLDCNHPETGQFDGHITSVEIYDGEGQLLDLFDERAGFYTDITQVKIGKTLTLTEGDDSLEISATVFPSKLRNAPCWEALKIHPRDLPELLNWLIEFSNFDSHGDEPYTPIWEEALNNDKTITLKDLWQN